MTALAEPLKAQKKEAAAKAVQLGADAAVRGNLKEIRPAVRNENTEGRKQ